MWLWVSWCVWNTSGPVGGSFPARGRQRGRLHVVEGSCRVVRVMRMLSQRRGSLGCICTWAELMGDRSQVGVTGDGVQVGVTNDRWVYVCVGDQDGWVCGVPGVTGECGTGDRVVTGGSSLSWSRGVGDPNPTAHHGTGWKKIVIACKKQCGTHSGCGCFGGCCPGCTGPCQDGLPPSSIY